MDESEADAVEPSVSTEDVFLDRGIGEEVDRGVSRHSLGNYFHLMSEGFERAIGSTKLRTDSRCEINPQFDSQVGFKDTVR